MSGGEIEVQWVLLVGDETKQAALESYYRDGWRAVAMAALMDGGRFSVILERERV